ncbi:tripartite tricarboxylate transporter TctB family protein [Halalkalibacter oceani]|uniref:tripartite tricarboxylate transporter TctB family protein n=1 Tax=Halalkalibacter oceani TaxID=1653776 RepID=UPI0033926CBA
MNKNVMSGSVVLIGAIIFTILAYGIPSSATAHQIGARIFPLTIGVLLMIISAVLLLSGLKEQRQQRGAEPQAEQSHEEEGGSLKRTRRKVIVLLLMLLLYISIFISFGYLLSTFLFIFGMTMFLEKKKWVRNTLYSILFPLVIYFLFNHILSVYLPSGTIF